MTSTPVKDVNFAAGILMPPGEAANAGRAAAGEFQAVLSRQTARQEGGEGPNAGSQAVKKTPGDSMKARDAHRARTEKREPIRNVEERADIPEEKLEEASQALAGAVNEVTRQVADTFGTEPKEVQELMAELGMEQEDILSAQGLGRLILAMAGAEDPSALLVDEELYGNYQELMEGLESALQEGADALGIDTAGFAELAQAAAARRMAEGQPTEEAVQVTDREPDALEEPVLREEPVLWEAPAAEEEPVVQEQQVPKAPVPEERPVPARQPEEPVRMYKPEEASAEPVREKPEAKREPESTATENRGPEQITAEKLTADETDGEKKTGQESGGRSHSEKHEGSREHGLNLFTQELRAEQAEPQVQQASETQSVWDADTQNIMRQIMDYMKVNLRAEMSSMEMQLHPESLGTLQVQIASRGGVVTANFITQNEAVKSVLEGQMIQLQQQFEEQGVKVGAIEVTVQTHQFEQNLEQGREGSRGQETARKGRTRRINLEEPLSFAEAEEDVLTREIMAANGNTVDYTA